MQCRLREILSLLTAVLLSTSYNMYEYRYSLTVYID